MSSTRCFGQNTCRCPQMWCAVECIASLPSFRCDIRFRSEPAPASCELDARASPSCAYLSLGCKTG
eukprot:10779181-Alexandrium_andersonii.AAC.1